jgi:DNA-binding transcriptional LysR family regulator
VVILMASSYDTTNIPIDTLRSLLTIIQAGGVTAAAARLGLTQPAVTAQIKKLERLVGGPLFEQSNITERGQTVARYASKIIAINDQLISAVGGQPGIVRLGLPPVMLTYRLHDVFTACSEIEDRIKLDIEPSKVLEKNLAGAFIDVALLVSERPRDGAALSWREKFAWVVSKDFELPPGRPLPFLAFPESISHKRGLEVLESKGISFRTILTSRDAANHFSFCESGRGVMVFPERYVPKNLTVADWLPDIPALDAGIYVRDGFEPAYLPSVIECLKVAFKP